MASAKDAPDPAEPDLYWSGQSGFAMLPGAVIGIVISAIAMLGAPPLGDWVHLPEEWIALARFWLVFLGWIAAGLVWSYRGAAFVYRLTPAHLYLEFGILYRPFPPMPLAAITNVECKSWGLRRLFRVGTVIVHCDGRRPVALRGIYRPNLFATAIQAAASARDQG